MSINLIANFIFGLVTLVAILLLVKNVIHYPENQNNEGIFWKRTRKRAARGYAMEFSIVLSWVVLFVVWLAIIDRQ